MLAADQDADRLDPLSWKKSIYPMMKSDPDRGVFGPGHNSFTVSEGGKDIMVSHARQYEKITGDPHYDPNRHAMLAEVHWDRHGNPVFEPYLY